MLELMQMQTQRNKNTINPDPRELLSGSTELLLGFQSYEYLTKVTPDMDRFLTGYPLEAVYGPRNPQLDAILDSADEIIGRARGGSATPDFRAAEVYYVSGLADLVEGKSSPELVDTLIEAGKELYGQVNPRAIAWAGSQIRGSIEQLKGRVSDNSLSVMLEELESGFEFTEKDGSVIRIPSVEDVFGKEGDSAEISLPYLSTESREKLVGLFERELEPSLRFIDEYLDSSDITPPYSPDDIVDIFQRAINAQLPDREDQITAVIKEGESAISWSSDGAAINVGSKRISIKTKEALKGVFMHEFGVHALRYINGKSLGNDQLASGLFMYDEDSDSSNVSYLDFEEGLASLIQKVVSGEELFSLKNMGYHVIANMADKGYGFREIHEFMVRFRAVQSLKDKGPDATLTEKGMGIHSRNSFKQLIRMFRGTPMNKTLNGSNGEVFYYPKDLTYANGIIQVIGFMEDHGEQSLKYMLSSGKIDPTNPAHLKFLETVLNQRSQTGA